MAPLITYEEALALGEIEDHAEIEALVERAFEARTERFGDSTDLCSLVNAKSGGCAEDCGFCGQSRFAEAPTPMHAMMTPEQILEHARAAEAAGAHRFCVGQPVDQRGEGVVGDREQEQFRRRGHGERVGDLGHPEQFSGAFAAGLADPGRGHELAQVTEQPEAGHVGGGVDRRGLGTVGTPRRVRVGQEPTS